MNPSINAANQALPCKTRTSNVTKHPGLPDLPSKKRTPAEKQTDEQDITDKQAAKVKTAVEQMALQQSEHPKGAVTEDPIMLRLPVPSSIKAKQQDESQAKRADDVAQGKKKSAKTKMALCEAISVARQQSQPEKAGTVGNLECPSTHGENSDKPMISSTKNVLAGRIKNWTTLVEKATAAPKKSLPPNPKLLRPVPSVSSSVTGKSETLPVSDTAGPPHTESIPSLHRTEYTVINNNNNNNTFQADKPDNSMPEELVGGFGNNDLDDEMERTAALLNKKQYNTVSITDLEDPESQVVPWADNDHFESLKRNHQQPAVQKVKSEPPASQPTSDTHISKQQPPMYYIYIDSKFIDSKTVKPHWFKDDEWKDGWKNQILPTLCLWASTQINIWSTPKDRVVSGLLLIIPVVFPQLTLYALQLTSAEACVGVGHQHLCNLHHGVGSAGLALCMSFFAHSTEKKITQDLGELLLENSFIYEDLDWKDGQKAFHANFIICLLATTYIPAIKGHVHVEGLDTHALEFCGIKGILSLSCTAIKRGLQLVTTVGLEGLMKTKAIPQPPTSFSKQAGKAIPTDNFFSDQKCGDTT
ncbi:hypothetical protein V8E55_005097 [Tylopilus felleus]